MLAGRILAGTPVYVWLVLVLLLMLGIRRLKPRRSHLLVAAAAPAGFLAWSLSTLAARAADGSHMAMIAAAGFSVGALSAPLRLVARPCYRAQGVFDLPASAVPLVAYMLLFWTRYSLEVMARVDAANAASYAQAGLLVTTLAAGRTIGDFVPLVMTVVAKAGPGPHLEAPPVE